MIKPNDQVGPYVLIRQLGKGGFGVVWLAERRSRLATTQVAVKLILDDEPDIDAIAKESQVWVQAGGHPNVLSIIEANVYDNQVVIVSEYVADGSLHDFLKQNKTISLLDSLNLTCGILAGLEHLHSRKIIHRDLKPANILLSKGVPRLADFGLARVMKSSNNSGSIAGTPYYMAPEAFDGKRSMQSDIWSVGIIFYQLLSGQLPFPQTDMTALVGAIINREPAPLPSSIPEQIKAEVKRALQKDPSKRFESATEMRLALQKIIAEVDLPTLNTEAITARLPILAFNTTENNISKDKSSTFGNRLNISTLPQGNILNTPNQTLQPTERVLQPTEKVSRPAFQAIPPTEVMRKEEPSKWKLYAALGVVAMTVPLAGFTYFNSQNPGDLSSKHIKISPQEKTGEIIVADSLPKNTTSLVSQPINQPTDQDREQIAWQKINKRPDQLRPSEINAYLKEFPEGLHAVEAKILLKEVEKLFAPQTTNSPELVPQNSNPSDKVILPSQTSDSTKQSSNMYMKTSDGKIIEVSGLGNNRSASQGQDSYNQNSDFSSNRQFNGNFPNNKPNKMNPYPPPNRQNRPMVNDFIGGGDWKEVTGAHVGRMIQIRQDGGFLGLSDHSLVRELTVIDNRVISYKTKDGGKEFKVEIEFLSDREAKKTCRSHDGSRFESKLVRLN